MPFTTIQDRALQIPRQYTPGSQFHKVKFQLGEMRTILPPVGTETINCQGVDIGPEGKKLQVTKELVALIQAGFVRIANDITNPDAEKNGGSLSPNSSGGDSDVGTAASHVAAEGDASAGVFSQLLGEGVTVSSPSLFSSQKEIEDCRDREKLRLYVMHYTTFANEKTHIEGLRDNALKLYREHNPNG